ncbi:MAG TPA: alpha/beta fold hydrolase [Jiangellaceae bacterium]
MGRQVRYVVVLVAAGLLVACTAQPSSDPEETPAPSARFLAGEPMTACTIKGEYPVEAEAPALCGVLRVPEDRSNPDGRQIGLRIAVVPAVAPDPEPDPLFVVAGGPGDAGKQFFAWLPRVFADVHATRDIVLIDQRGTGDSNPLMLPERPDTAGLAETVADEVLSAWASESLASIDADPRFYTTTVAADDLDEVRTALGYETINLYGTSYGGTLVQYYLRQHGEHVRVAVLDGSTPVDVQVFERMAASSQAALDLLFQRCAEDASCHEAFPQLAEEWTALVDRLAIPLTLVDPESGDEAVIDQIGLAEAIHAALLTESTAVQIPLAVHLAYQEQWFEAAKLIGVEPPGGPTLLMADEIFCSEAWARFDPAEVAHQGAGSYALARELSEAEERGVICRYLPHGVVPEDDAAAVRTDTPVLWLVGDGDPQDPPANLAVVPVQQPNSRIVVMPAQQHVVGHLGCMPSVIAAFLDAGSANRLDTSCVAQGAPAPPFRLE